MALTVPIGAGRAHHLLALAAQPFREDIRSHRAPAVTIRNAVLMPKTQGLAPEEQGST